MLFNSLDFLLFFPVVTALYFALPPRLRWFALLAASCYFYMAFVPVYILILAFTIVVDYFAGIVIERSQGARRKAFLIASLIANIGVLAVFKYYNFFNGTFGEPLPVLAILLPIGLSFHTFQAMSYTIEVYRGHQKAERHFGLYALYVMFYPQLVAGPIERPQNLLPQFHEDRERGHTWDWARVQSGLQLILWGFFLKLVIADRAGVYVRAVWADMGAQGAAEVWLASCLGSYQFYGDFAGYSLIAIGTARVMGYTLMQNFDRPFASESVGEFWRRFHMSLMTWFRDYLFVPLNGGGRVSKRRGLFSLFIVFLVSGLWHGAGWTYVLWGALHGTFVVVGNLTRRGRNKLWKRIADFEVSLRSRSPAAVRAAGLPGPSAFRLPLVVPGLRKALAIIITFHCYAISGLLFCAPNIEGTWTAAKALLTLKDVDGPFSWAAMPGLSTVQLLVLVGAIVFLEVWQYFDDRESIFARLARLPRAVRWTVYYALIFGILFFGMLDAHVFIYFQF
jgi:D-alanyl-lipoteichoic acid acyltransferase DltB (MBOAT superfamily)